MSFRESQFPTFDDDFWERRSVSTISRPSVRKSIFISYRRLDSADSTGRLHDRLGKVFPNSIFHDIDSIKAGEDFQKAIAEELLTADLVIAVIGPNWATMRDNDGTCRLSNPNDFVRLEIETAINLKKKILPVLVMWAKMPKESELPESIRPLAGKQALQVRPDPDFGPDSKYLCGTIENLLGLKQQPGLAEVVDNVIDAAEKDRMNNQSRVESFREELLNKLQRTTHRLEQATSDRHAELIMTIQRICGQLDSISESLQAQQKHLSRLDGSVGEVLRYNGLVDELAD